MSYPEGTPSSGVYDVFKNNSFTPDDVVKAIRDNHTPVNRMNMLISLGYQVSLVQNFVNSRYLARSATPVQESFITSGYFDNVLCLSGAISSDFTYTNINDYFIDVRKNQGGVCGYTHIYPMEVQLKRFGAPTDAWTSYLNVSGINWVPTAGIKNIRIQANKAHEVILANPSTQDDNPAYSGILKMYANEITLQSVSNKFNLLPTAGGPSYLNFCGTTLVISGINTASKIYVSNKLLPSQIINEFAGTGQDLGEDSPQYRGFLNGYIQTVHTKANYKTDISLGTGGTKYFVGSFGGVCGASIDDRDYGVKVSSTYVGLGTYQYLDGGLGPNKIYLGRRQNLQTPVSGYLYLNSGQLEFYSETDGSGWVLTGF